MDKKTYLCRYHNIQEQIEKKKRYIEFCDERSLSILGPNYGERINNPNQNTEAPFVRWIFKRIEAEEELEELEKKLKVVKMEIEKAINTIQDEELQMVLTYRYIDWLTWDEICGRIYCSISSVKRKHEKAIDFLKI